MPQNLTCPGCDHAFVVPDHLSGQTLACPKCSVAVISEAPLMPPPMPGAASQSPDAAAPVVFAPSNAPSPTPEPARPSAAPPRSATAQAQPSPAPPSITPSHTPPVSHAAASHPAPRSGSAGVAIHESATRAHRLGKSNRGTGWVMGILALGLIVAGGFVIFKKVKTVNPPVASIEERLDPSTEAIQMLGDRQRAVGYSFQLPKGFVPTDAPTTRGLPSGTRSWAWTADEGSPEAGSEFRVWMIPQEYPLAKKLASMKDTGSWLDVKSIVTSRSSYRRIGREFLAVRGLLVDLEGQGRSVGVLYLLSEGDQTVMAIGMGAGRKAKDIQYLLDHAVRTIKRE